RLSGQPDSCLRQFRTNKFDNLRRFFPEPRATKAWLALFLVVGLAGCASFKSSTDTGPWDVHALSKAPVVTWGATTGLVQELFYEGELLEGKPTRVFAYLGRPTNSASGKNPAMVLVH